MLFDIDIKISLLYSANLLAMQIAQLPRKGNCQWNKDVFNLTSMIIVFIVLSGTAEFALSKPALSINKLGSIHAPGSQLSCHSASLEVSPLPALST